jgi:hypothetical protein
MNEGTEERIKALEERVAALEKLLAPQENRRHQASDKPWGDIEQLFSKRKEGAVEGDRRINANPVPTVADIERQFGKPSGVRREVEQKNNL